MSLPEPTFPEHELIRAAAPSTELSAGLKHRVMSECASQIRRSRFRKRAAITTLTFAACGLMLAVSVQPPAGDAQRNSAQMDNLDRDNGTRRSPSSRHTPSADNSRIASDQVRPAGAPQTNGLPLPKETQQIDDLIRQRLERDRLLECALLPFL
jgi:hypothetical protein